MSIYKEMSNFKAPFLPPDKIESIVQKFLSDHWPQDTIPINIYKIAEYNLGLEIIPVPNLFRYTGIEASLLGDGSAIFIDFDQFNNDYYENRLRFSVAHEIGHKVLHSNLYNRTEPEDIDSLLKLFDSIPDKEYHWIETQANQFAGRLLVPTKKLIEKVNTNEELIMQIKQSRNENSDGDQIAEYYAHHLNKYFGVSEDVMIIRLKNERIINKII